MAWWRELFSELTDMFKAGKPVTRQEHFERHRIYAWIEESFANLELIDPALIDKLTPVEVHCLAFEVYTALFELIDSALWANSADIQKEELILGSTSNAFDRFITRRLRGDYAHSDDN